MMMMMMCVCLEQRTTFPPSSDVLIKEGTVNFSSRWAFHNIRPPINLEHLILPISSN